MRGRTRRVEASGVRCVSGRRLDAHRSRPVTFRAALLVGLSAEVRFITGAAEGRWGFEESDAGAIRRWVVRHGVGLVAAKSLRDLLPIAEELAGPPRCDHPAGASSGRKAAWFDDLFPDFMAAFTAYPRRVDALALQFELTRRVLALRKAAAESGGTGKWWPDASAQPLPMECALSLR